MSKHFVRFKEQPGATLRLFCFPYAGGGAANFRLWASILPPNIELYCIEYPGRIHLKDKPADNMEELINVLYPEILPLVDLPFAFFGHSFGSSVAYALAKRLEQEGKAPKHLFTSSRRPPQVPFQMEMSWNLTDSQFIEVIQKRFGAIPEAVLNDKHLMSMFLPSLKCDMRINEEYLGEIPIHVPVTFYYGTQDQTGSNAQFERWKEVTTGPFEAKSFNGGHFYIDSHRDALIQDIVSTLCR